MLKLLHKATHEFRLTAKGGHQFKSRTLTRHRLYKESARMDRS
jgi:hypothetical protein